MCSLSLKALVKFEVDLTITQDQFSHISLQLLFTLASVRLADPFLCVGESLPVWKHVHFCLNNMNMLDRMCPP